MCLATRLKQLQRSDDGSERSSRAGSGSSMARRSGEQEHDEERARCLVEQEQEQEHGEGRAQRLKQVSPGLCCSEDGEGVWRLR